MMFSDKNISSNLIFSISGASPGSEAPRVEIADPVPTLARGAANSNPGTRFSGSRIGDCGVCTPCEGIDSTGTTQDNLDTMFMLKYIRLCRPLVLATPYQTAWAAHGKINGFGCILDSPVRDLGAEIELGWVHPTIPRGIR